MRPLHIGLFGVVAIAAVILFWITRDSDSDSGSGSGENAKSADPVSKSSNKSQNSTATPGEGAQTPPREPTPGSDDVEPTNGRTGDDVPEVYADDGRRIRDHRTGNAPPPDPSLPLRRPANTKRIDSKIIAKMGLAVSQAAKRCAKEHSGDLGDAPELEPSITYSIIGGVLTINELELGGADIREGGALHGCVKDAAMALSVEAPGHRDVESDTMSTKIKL